MRQYGKLVAPSADEITRKPTRTMGLTAGEIMREIYRVRLVTEDGGESFTGYDRFFNDYGGYDRSEVLEALAQAIRLGRDRVVLGDMSARVQRVAAELGKGRRRGRTAA
jgi:hypothetical protein